MGAYVSKPVTDKTSIDEEKECLSYGASSMQGWRISQEDAHNAIMDFDTETSFFAVYDGHGGHEVAEYTAQKLPNFIKKSETYKKGELEKCLTESFLKFDSSLVTAEILNVLKEISGTKDDTSPDSEKEEVDHLCREASMPLEEVIAKYSENNKFQSPFIRAKASSSCSKAGCSSSSSSSSVGKFVLLDSDDENEDDETKDDSSIEAQPSKSEVSTSESLGKEPNQDSKPEANIASPSSKLCNGNSTETNPECASSDVSSIPSDEKNGVKGEKCDSNCDDKINSETDIIKSTSLKSDSKIKEEAEIKSEAPSDVINGKTNGTTAEESSGSPPGGKGGKRGVFGKLIPQRAKCEEKSFPKKPKRLAAAKAEEIYKQIQGGVELDSSSDEDLDGEEELELQPGGLSSEDLDVEDECEEESEIDEEEDSSEEDEDLEEDCEDEGVYNEAQIGLTEEPGFDSGCTACVTLLRGSTLYVANVGDSRCVVCRDGDAYDMSLDHKPEDEPEANRIIKAGGKVTDDGRVNGGLNLSRALGDHSYKLNKTLPAEEQMISPLPDIKVLHLEEKDRFMILACDGIWNSMSSQEACDFVSKKLEQGNKLSTICEQLFDYCLAPNVEGDGAGCDNMTCIIVDFRPKTKSNSDSGNSQAAVIAKRPFAELTSDENTQEVTTNGVQEKKIKLSLEAS